MNHTAFWDVCVEVSLHHVDDLREPRWRRCALTSLDLAPGGHEFRSPASDARPGAGPDAAVRPRALRGTGGNRRSGTAREAGRGGKQEPPATMARDRRLITPDQERNYAVQPSVFGPAAGGLCAVEEHEAFALVAVSAFASCGAASGAGHQRALVRNSWMAARS